MKLYTRTSKVRLIFLYFVALFLIMCIWLNKNNAFNENYDLTEAIRLHELDIQSRIISERGSGCTIPKTDPFSKEVMSYIKETPQLICKGFDWVTCEGSRCFVKPKVLRTAPDIQCTYRNIIYVNDNKYHIGEPSVVKGGESYNLTLSDHVKVSCVKNPSFPFNLWSRRWNGIKAGLRPIYVYEYERYMLGAEEPSVLILAIDSISHNQFLRKLPQSYKVLTENLKAVVLNKYNIVGDGTPAALFPILTGKTELEMTDARKMNKDAYFDPNDFLFGLLQSEGYRTAYFEDGPKIGTFQTRFNGFSRCPAHHYLRPFFLEHGQDRFCIGATPVHKILLSLTEQFIKRPRRKFCFTMVSAISHDDADQVSVMDNDLSQFLVDLKQSLVLRNILLIVMADHGARFTEYRMTFQGKLEERLPFAAIVLPEITKFNPSVEEALLANANVLTTPFDIHTTILDVIQLQHFSNLYSVPNSNLMRAMSLLKPIPASRSCAEADIAVHFCSCFQWANVTTEDVMYKRAAYTLADAINSIASRCIKCAPRKIVKIDWVLRRTPRSGDRNLGIHSTGKRHTIEYYQVRLVMDPASAVYEGTVMHLHYGDDLFTSKNDISRVNSYGDEDRCVRDTLPHISKFCYCLED